MMTWAPGNNFLSCAVHSTPDMLGDWMPISTTSGAEFRSSRKASSPVPHAPTHWHPRARLTIVSKLLRIVELSSIMATSIVILFGQAHAEKLDCAWGRSTLDLIPLLFMG